MSPCTAGGSAGEEGPEERYGGLGAFPLHALLGLVQAAPQVLAVFQWFEADLGLRGHLHGEADFGVEAWLVIGKTHDGGIHPEAVGQTEGAQRPRESGLLQ